jgi:hypothetical protein
VSPLRRGPGPKRTPFRPARRKPTGFTPATKAAIHDRDGDRCCLCGFIFPRSELTAHHRRNRQAGGSTVPEANSVRNGLTLCWGDNGLIESNADRAQEARDWGIKLESWQELDRPVLYPDGQWYVLDIFGQRRPVPDEDAA